MQLQDISTISDGDAFLLAFMANYNARFAKAPDDRDLHRSCTEHDDLGDAFVWKEERSISVNLTLHYDQVMFILVPNEITRSLAPRWPAGGLNSWWWANIFGWKCCASSWGASSLGRKIR